MPESREIRVLAWWEGSVAQAYVHATGLEAEQVAEVCAVVAKALGVETAPQDADAFAAEMTTSDVQGEVPPQGSSLRKAMDAAGVTL